MYSVNKTSQRSSEREAQTRGGTRGAASGSCSASTKKSSAARTSKRKAEAEERTRDRVLRGVLNHGPVSAASLGELLSLTPAAVRRHLDALESSNMIEVAPIKKHGAGAGRPARRYVIAPQGHERLGNDYLLIARNALQMLRDTVGDGALEAFASARAAEMEARYRPVVEAAGDNVAARAKALAEAMSRDGFVATAQVTEPPVGRSAVSYTHLDVYKRQPLESAPAKMVGLVVTPTTLWVLMSSARLPLVRRSRERSSSQMETPASESF